MLKAPPVGEKTDLTNEDLRNAIRSSYAVFCQTFQDDGWFDPVHKELCDWAQYWIEDALQKGDDCKLMLVMPRGSLKTTILTKYLPVWLTLDDPNFRSLIVTNTHTNARKKLQDTRGLFDVDKLFRALYPDLLPRGKNRWTNEAAEINRPKVFPEATFEAAGVGTAKVGLHYNLIIEDDTVAPDESEMQGDVTLPSRDRIEKGIGYHRTATALLVPKGPRIRIVVSTRWGEYDLIQYVRDEEQGYKVFDIPAIQDAGVQNWEEGTPNFSMFYSIDKLKDIERQLGPYMFACLYLNMPMDASLRVFQDAWFKWCTPSEIPDDGFITLAVDPAISEKDEACETAITSVKHHMLQDRQPFQYYRKVIHGHFNVNQLINKTLDLAEFYVEEGEDVKMIIVETIAYQKALKYMFWDEMNRRDMSFPIVEFASRQQKEVRIEGTLVPRFSNGRIFFVRGEFPEKAESQFKQFPTGKLLDIVDSCSMHIKAYRGEKRYYEAPKKDPRMEDSWDDVMDEIRYNVKNRDRKGSLHYLTQYNTNSLGRSLKTNTKYDMDFLLNGVRDGN